MMLDVTRAELVDLASQEFDHSVSVYLPLHRNPAETQQNAIQLRNLLDQAEERLTTGGMRGPEARELLQPAREVAADTSTLIRSGAQGLAVLLAPQFAKIVRLSYAVPTSLDVARRFYLTPLVPATQREEPFYLLALSQKSVRLYRCDRRTIAPVSLPDDVPRSLEEALAGTEIEKSLQQHTAGPVGQAGTGIVHGHGSPKDDQKVLLTEYFRIVARHLKTALENQQRPIVLAAVEYCHPMFRDVFADPRLVDRGVLGSADEMTEPELHAKALPLIEPYWNEPRNRALARYRDAIGGQSAGKTLEEILPAAYGGKVEFLFAALGERTWGHYDRESDELTIHETPQTGDVDLLDDAVRQAVMRGGEVYVLSKSEMPDDASIAALFRW